MTRSSVILGKGDSREQWAGSQLAMGWGVKRDEYVKLLWVSAISMPGLTVKEQVAFRRCLLKDIFSILGDDWMCTGKLKLESEIDTTWSGPWGSEMAWDLHRKTVSSPLRWEEMRPVLLIWISFVIDLLPQDKLTQYFHMELVIIKKYFKL